MSALTAFDIVVMLLIGLTALFGLWRGFVFELLSLIAWVAAVLALRILYEPGSAIATSMTGTETGGAILAFVLIFLVTFVGFKFVARILSAKIKKSAIGPLDRVLGLGFGALKGLIVASLAFLLINLFFDVVWGAASPKPEWLSASKTQPLLKLSSQAIADWVDERRSPASAEPGYKDGERDAMDELVDDKS